MQYFSVILGVALVACFYVQLSTASAIKADQPLKELNLETIISEIAHIAAEGLDEKEVTREARDIENAENLDPVEYQALDAPSTGTRKERDILKTIVTVRKVSGVVKAVLTSVGVGGAGAVVATVVLVTAAVAGVNVVKNLLLPLLGGEVEKSVIVKAIKLVLGVV